MYKNIYTIYKEGAIFCYFFFIFCCKGVLGEELFSQRLNWQKLARPLSVINFQLTLLCYLLLPWHHSLTSTAPCAGQNGTGVPSAPFTAIYPRQQHTDICKLYATKWQTLPLFWNCVCKSYIFTCRLLLFCVLEICCIGFFVKRWKSKIQCVLKNVSHWKCSEVKSSESFFFPHYVYYLWGTILRVRGRNQKS